MSVSAADAGPMRLTILNLGRDRDSLAMRGGDVDAVGSRDRREGTEVKRCDTCCASSLG